MEADVSIEKNVFEFNESTSLVEGLVYGENNKEVCVKLGLKKKPFIGVARGRRLLKEIRTLEEESCRNSLFLENDEEIKMKEVGRDRPRFSIWENDKGEELLEMRFDRAGVSIVIEEGLKNRESEGAGLTYKLKGYDIKHMLVEGEDGSVVDMMSTAPEDKLPPVMLTLSENGEISGRSCSFQENPRTPAVLSFGYLKQDKFEFSWDIGDIAELFLHETGHHLIIANNRRIGRDNIQAERDTNALAILRSRDINKKLARKFFDVEKVRSWIQGQLKRGYDEEELTGKKYPASTKQRNEMFKERRLNNLARVRESLKKIVDEPDSRN